MTTQTLKIGGRQFVVVPQRDFDRLRAQAERQEKQDRQDAGDVAEAKRRKARGGSKPYSELRKKLGLA
jgi:hypothetical protein